LPAWSVTAAREEAKRLKREVDGGGEVSELRVFHTAQERVFVAKVCA